ncbi:universal stress protein [Spongiivirga citrea]|uniref:Universal stress protein n=1 Tax=Spongiivirga citrea TaxID=1481457 RepID=A0A6M0CPP1_9FLAO|nr:universal stress protein [Spongiivirga citrea]NER15890.1 universal stress protein [Spongiivirga citrea]
MNTITTILVPFNNSVTSEVALNYAINFSKNEEDITILLATIENGDVVPNYDPRVHFDRVISTYKRPPKVKVDFLTGKGDLINNLVELQIAKRADIIIMGTKGTSDSDTAESNTSKLVLAADCPVIVVPKHIKTNSISKIALAIGAEPIDEPSSLNVLLDVSRRFGAQVHVLSIDNDSTNFSAIDEKTENTLEYYLESFYTKHAFPESSDILQGIFDYVNKNQIDLLAILPRNHIKKGEASKGKLTKLLTLHSQVPVLAID